MKERYIDRVYFDVTWKVGKKKKFTEKDFKNDERLKKMRKVIKEGVFGIGIVTVEIVGMDFHGEADDDDYEYPSSRLD